MRPGGVTASSSGWTTRREAAATRAEILRAQDRCGRGGLAGRAGLALEHLEHLERREGRPWSERCGRARGLGAPRRETNRRPIDENRHSEGDLRFQAPPPALEGAGQNHGSGRRNAVTARQIRRGRR